MLRLEATEILNGGCESFACCKVAGRMSNADVSYSLVRLATLGSRAFEGFVVRNFQTTSDWIDFLLRSIGRA